MKLVIDWGNTLCKTAVFKDEKIIYHSSVKQMDVNHWKLFFKKHSGIRSVILSSVVNHPKEIVRFLKKQYLFTELTSNTPLPLQNLYTTPETLGKDRIAAAVGANHLFPDTNVLVIDAGTCIKYDFVNRNNQYLGVAISPGIDMHLQALHEFTDKLPLVKQKKINTLTGRTTAESILSGVVNGSIEEMRGIIGQYQKQYRGIKIIITGGDADFFEKQLKTTIFAEPFLVLKGLNIILDYNAK